MRVNVCVHVVYVVQWSDCCRGLSLHQMNYTHGSPFVGFYCALLVYHRSMKIYPSLLLHLHWGNHIIAQRQ